MTKHDTTVIKELIKFQCLDMALHIRAESLINETGEVIDRVIDELTEYAIDELKRQIEMTKKMTEKEIRGWLLAEIVEDMRKVI